jgi:hypothetical protein
MAFETSMPATSRFTAGPAVQAVVPRPFAGVDLKGLRPEALFVWPGSNRLQLFSDDGGIEAGGLACKDLPPTGRVFRVIEWER